MKFPTDCGAFLVKSSTVMLPWLVSISTRGLAGWPGAGAVETVCLPGSLAPQPDMPSRIAPRNSVVDNRGKRAIGNTLGKEKERF